MNKLRNFITNKFVFCNSPFDYDKINILSKNIIFIERGQNKDDIKNYIPCLFIPAYEETSKFLIFFHGNAEDIFSCELFCQHLSEYLKMNVVIVEYPGYSIYKSDIGESIIYDDSKKVYDFIINKFKLKYEDIYIAGRSLGTGPATFLAKEKKSKSLILISPYKSIKSIKNCFYSYFLLDIFKSIDIIHKVLCPIIFIHGKKDNLIDFNHSKDLNSKAKKNKNKNDLVLNEEMAHNDFDLEKDIIKQILTHLKEDPNSFPKHTLNLDDDKFKYLFNIPNPIQNYFFKLNIQKSKPTTFEKNAKCSLLLKDGRIAFGVNNNIMIYNIDWCLNEKEIIIKLKNKNSIHYMTQLRNNLLAVCDTINVYFYSLKNYKYKEITIYKPKNIEIKIKKIDQLNRGDLIILTENSIEIINEQFKFITEKNGKYKDLTVVFNTIIASNLNSINIIEYQNEQKIITTKQITFKTIDSIYSLINLDNSKFIGLGKEQYIVHDINKTIINFYEHKINEPSHISKVDSNSYLIWNEIGNIYYFGKNGNLIANLIISNKITSIIKFIDGSLIITKDSNNQEDGECKIF